MNSPSGRVRVVAGKPRPSGWRRLFSLKLWLAVFSLIVLLGAGAAAAAYRLVDIPDPNKSAQLQTSIVYFSDGKTEMARMSALDRQAVPLSEVSTDMQHAILAAEDRSFYDNPGISVQGIGRAVWTAITGGATQGGSTITQQYVKNYFLTQDRTMSRKLREIIISLKVEQELSKDEILQGYLNTIYYGRGAYGIQAASQAYFGKDAKDLDVGESAFLASVIRGPSLYDPTLGAEQKKNAQSRVNYVLDGMVEQGWLDAAERKTITFPKIGKQKERSDRSGPNGYIVQMVRDELQSKVGLTAEEVERGGLKIVTTIDKDKQTAAIRAVENNLPTPKVRTGLVSMKPGDGAIVALYGGANAVKQPYNAATQAQLQGGSTFKVFTLVNALEQGISTSTHVDASSPKYFEEFKGSGNENGEVHNYNDEQLGWISLKQALAHSSNTAFAALNIEAGPAKTRDVAVKMGLPQNTLGLSDNPANVFGTASPRVIDMAKAYATLAAGGVRSDPYVIAGVDSNDPSFSGYKAQPSTERVVEEDVAADAVDAMRAVVENGTAKGARAIGRPAAGKTGTTDENRAVWFDGFTPDLVTAVGMYLPDEQGNAVPMRGAGLGNGVTGGSFPVDVWTAYMKQAVQGTEWKDFPEPADIGDGGSLSQDQQTSEPQQPPQQPEQTNDWTPPAPQQQPPSQAPWSPTDVAPAPNTETPDSAPSASNDGGNNGGTGNDGGAGTDQSGSGPRGDATATPNGGRDGRGGQAPAGDATATPAAA